MSNQKLSPIEKAYFSGAVGSRKWYRREVLRKRKEAKRIHRLANLEKGERLGGKDKGTPDTRYVGPYWYMGKELIQLPNEKFMLVDAEKSRIPSRCKTNSVWNGIHTESGLMKTEAQLAVMCCHHQEQR